MSIQEKRAIVSIVSTIAITAVYAAFMLARQPDAGPYAPETLRFWGVFFLALVPVSIVAKIIIYILFSILNTIATREEEPAITDERDRLIELKANRNAHYLFILGFLLAMILLAAGSPPSTMFITFVAAGVAADVVSEASHFYFYRRGY